MATEPGAATAIERRDRAKTTERRSVERSATKVRTRKRATPLPKRRRGPSKRCGLRGAALYRDEPLAKRAIGLRLGRAGQGQGKRTDGKQSKHGGSFRSIRLNAYVEAVGWSSWGTGAGAAPFNRSNIELNI